MAPWIPQGLLEILLKLTLIYYHSFSKWGQLKWIGHYIFMFFQYQINRVLLLTEFGQLIKIML